MAELKTKTLVVATHPPGPHTNSVGGCMARDGEGGMCPGVAIARWLNDLGDDQDVYLEYTTRPERTITNGEVRRNWLRGCYHIVALDPALAECMARQVTLRKELKSVNRRLAEIAAERTRLAREVK